MPAVTPFRTRVVRLARLVLAVATTWYRAVARGPMIVDASWRRLVESAAARMLAALAVEVEVRGARPLTEGPVLFVANHVSWLDVQALGTIAGPRFVAKAEVERWPVLGRLTACLGTVFHVRGNRRDAARVKRILAKHLVSGERVAVFPEGTTSDGSRVGRFYAALLQAAVDAAVAVQPVAIRYREPEGAPGTAAAFIDDMTFGASLARILARPGLVAELTFGPPIYAGDKTRRELVALTRGFIVQALGLEAPAEQRGARPFRRAA